MQFILILISFLLFYNFSISKDTKEIISKTHFKTEVKTFNLKNGINFSSFTSEGSWENNLGNYRINKCLGTVKKMPSLQKCYRKRIGQVSDTWSKITRKYKT